MTIKEFRELDKDSDEFDEISTNFCEMVTEISNELVDLFIMYKETELKQGETFGNGPSYQFYNGLIKEFIRKS